MSSQLDVVLQYGKENTEVTDFLTSKEDILIGRAPECDIHLDDKEVSRFHASLKITPDGFWLLDMNSTNGTLIDDKPIPSNRRVEIHPEQKFIIGGYTFKLRLSQVESDRTILQAAKPRIEMYDLDALRKTEFPEMLHRTHLDNAATAPAPLRTLQKMRWMLDEKIATTQWDAGSFALDLYGSFQTTIAKFLNAESANEIVFVEGCSVGLNLIAQSLDIRAGDNIAFCDLEHTANVYPWMSLQRDGVEVKQVPSVCGGLTLDALRQVVDERTRLVAASAVQFFSGHRTDLAPIGKFCRERNIIFAVDAIQAVGHMPIDVQKMNIDVLVTGGHKSIMAIPTAGFMYVREAICSSLKPRVVGAVSTADWTYYLKYDMTPGPGAWRFLIGTPNFVGMAGVIQSITLINELTREAIDQHTTNLAARTLETARARGYELTTTPGWHGSIATFKSKFDRDRTNTMLAKIEEEEHIHIAKHPDRQGHPHLRISFHCYNTEEDVTRAFEALDMIQ